MISQEELITKAKIIRLVLTDVDGVLTDAGVYYGADGEVLKRFNMKDGMGVERLKTLCNIETGIITGELSPSVAKRAEKLKITELHLGIKNKMEVLTKILQTKNLQLSQVAYIGDDLNDLEVLTNVGLSACPFDAFDTVKQNVHYICSLNGGQACFRQFAELIIESKINK